MNLAKYGVLKSGGCYWLNNKQLGYDDTELLKEILSCPLRDLPMYMGDEKFSNIIEKRFKEEELK